MMKKLTRNQKVYVAVLGVALLVLVCDQLLFSPGKAGAAETAAFHPSVSPTARAKATADRIPELLAAVRKPEDTLASRLAVVAETQSLDVENMNDAMRAPAHWFPVEGAAPPVVVEATGSHEAALKFRSTHQLNAVMANADGGYAIVNGRPLRIGQEITGFTLVEVRARSVVFENAGSIVELRLPTGE